jgi:subtilisin family serine protease
MSRRLTRIGIGALLLLTMLAGPSLAAAAPPADAAGNKERFIVVARSAADYDNLRAAVEKAGGSVVKDMREGGMLVATGATSLKSQIAATGLSKGVAKDHIESVIQPSALRDLTNGMAARSRTTVDSATSRAVAEAQGRRPPVTGDPAFGFPGLMWSIERIQAPQAWQTTTGSGQVKVGVADTGLDFTHVELAPKVTNVVDFTVTENPPICSTFFANPFDPSQPGIGDADLAAMFGGPEKTDWNGHGSWIGGNIAGALDGQGINGIAPKVKLVSLKISQWCGSAYDSTILDAFLYAGNHNIDIVSISFGGYLDLSDPDQAIIWGQYNQVVQRVRDQGTIIAAAAGNEHVQIGQSGLVTSHGPLATPGAPFNDIFGQFEVPGGVPGVIDVASTGNVVIPSSTACLPGQSGSSSDLNAVCKPTSDRHQAGGQGKQDQLSYFSNYGSRIDVAGPGGARKFNLPFWDRGGTPGFPYTSTDFTTAFEDFSTTSNWAVEIPCFVFTGGGFPANNCYSTIQGTSMATPHASGVLALIASNDPSARGNPNKLERILKNSARHVSGNKTQVLSASDTSDSDLTDVACPTGYCHLGGAAVPDNEAYGAGIVDARRAVNR